MSNTALIRYDMKLPNKAVYQFLRVLGIVLNVIAAVWAFGLFIWWGISMVTAKYVFDSNSLHDYGHFVDGTGFQWQFWFIPLAVLAIGVTLVATFGTRFTRYYRDVHQGKLVIKDTSGGGNSPIQWCLLIEGHTYANELRRDWHYVNAGYWNQVVLGEYIDFR